MSSLGSTACKINEIADYPANPQTFERILLHRRVTQNVEGCNSQQEQKYNLTGGGGQDYFLYLVYREGSLDTLGGERV